MTTRRRVLVLALALAVVAVGGALLITAAHFLHRGQVTAENLRRIRTGTTMAEAARILGPPTATGTYNVKAVGSGEYKFYGPSDSPEHPDGYQRFPYYRWQTDD